MNIYRNKVSRSQERSRGIFGEFPNFSEIKEFPTQFLLPGTRNIQLRGHLMVDILILKVLHPNLKIPCVLWTLLFIKKIKIFQKATHLVHSPLYCYFTRRIKCWIWINCSVGILCLNY